MYIITPDYFQKQYTIPNIDEMDSKNATVLEICIDQYVRVCLQNALGYNLWKELNLNIKDGVLDIGAPQKWLDLVNGKTYTKDGKTFTWKGLIYTEGIYKGSLLVPFVYYHFLKENVSLLTGTGEKVLDASNAIGVNSTQRMVMSWNDFVNQYQGQSLFSHHVNRYYHDGVLVEDYFTGNDSEQVNLIQYLEDNQADYIDAHKRLYKIQNQLGL